MEKLILRWEKIANAIELSCSDVVNRRHRIALSSKADAIRMCIDDVKRHLTSDVHSDGKDQGFCGDDHTCLINDRIVKINE